MPGDGGVGEGRGIRVILKIFFGSVTFQNFCSLRCYFKVERVCDVIPLNTHLYSVTDLIFPSLHCLSFQAGP